MAKPETPQRLIAENRRARFDYFIEERLEAGLALEGWEVKAMRAGRAQLAEAYVYIRNSEAFLIGCHIAPLNTASTHKIADPVRTRKLLLQPQRTRSPDRRGRAARLHARAARTVLEARAAPNCSSAWPRARSSTTSAPTEKDRDWVRDKARLLRRG